MRSPKLGGQFPSLEVFRIDKALGTIIKSERLDKPTKTSTANHVPKCHMHTAFKPLQGWELHQCQGWTPLSMKKYPV